MKIEISKTVQCRISPFLNFDEIRNFYPEVSTSTLHLAANTLGDTYHFYSILPQSTIIIPNCLYYCTIDLETDDFMTQFTKSYTIDDKQYLLYRLADSSFSKSFQDSLQLTNIQSVFDNVLTLVIVNVSDTNITLNYGMNAFCLERMSD